MPLLRLVNQIVTMHLNAKETNEELREKRTSVTKVTFLCQRCIMNICHMKILFMNMEGFNYE